MHSMVGFMVKCLFFTRTFAVKLFVVNTFYIPGKKRKDVSLDIKMHKI